MKYILPFFVAIFSFLWVYHRTDGFFLEKICFNDGTHSEWETKADTQIIKEALSQNYRYLSKGRQCFVFQSQDGSYVIKFFNRDRFRIPFGLQTIPLGPCEKIRKKKMQKKSERLFFYFSSYHLAYEKLKEESALLYVHINPSSILPALQITDKASRTFCIDLNRIPFVLQKKMIPLKEAFASFTSEERKRAIASLLEAMAKRISKGIADDDVDAPINYGFIGEKAFVFDAGRFFENKALLTQEGQKKELFKSTKRFRKWLLEKGLETAFLEERLQRFCSL